MVTIVEESFERALEESFEGSVDIRTAALSRGTSG
jgi:hypothetical protein